MSNARTTSGARLQRVCALLGLALFVHLIVRANPRVLWAQIVPLWFGIAIIIVLGGVTHLVKTWAWRLTLTCDVSRLSWRRSFVVRLISEALGQLGVVGKLFGEGARVSLISGSIPVSDAVASAALDSGLFTLTSAFVSMTAILVGLQLTTFPVAIKFSASVVAGLLAAVLTLTAIAIARGYRALGALFDLLARVPRLSDWVRSKREVIERTEQNLLGFHRKAPAAFRLSLLLNFVAHALAIAEVFVIIRYLSGSATLLAAFVLEGLTKVINLVGSLNPGNFGTYEGGNMLIVRLFGLSASAGLTVALCRRMRAMFWASVGAICLALIRGEKKGSETEVEKKEESTSSGNSVFSEHRRTVVILADWEAPSAAPALTAIATLPNLLRNILSAKAEGAERIIVCVRECLAQYRSVLADTGRLPEDVEWRQVRDRNLISIIADISLNSDLVLVLGNRIYEPKLLREALQWTHPRALAFVSEGELVGISVISQEAAAEIGNTGLNIRSFGRLHSFLQCLRWIDLREIGPGRFHPVASAADTQEAERKMEAWLLKPTDGIFARANRRISIPISRKLIHLPISPNMVSLFVLGVSLLCGYFYAVGGYWNALIAALLGVAGSILDGCDGEVARFKVQSTAFGCWLDTWCDYAWYAVAFVGMGIGLQRVSASGHYYEWGAALLLGTLLIFAVVSIMRRDLAKSHPERFLGMWQQKAEDRKSNPLLYLGRNTEFILRRCFLPYLLLVFAVLGLTNVVFILAALGANIAWLIALYSYVVFARQTAGHVITAAAGSRNA